MSLIIPEDYVNLTFHFQLPGDSEDMLTSLAFLTDAAVTDSDLDDMAAAVATMCVSFVGGNSALTRIVMQTGAAAPPYLVTERAVEEGFSSGDSFPPNTAALIKKVTLQPGRPGRGRCYIPNILRTRADSAGRWGNSPLVAAQAALDTFFSGAAVASPFAGLVLLHDTSSPVSTPNVITQLIMESTLATQRRRLRP